MNTIVRCHGKNCDAKIIVPKEQVNEKTVYTCVECSGLDTKNIDLHFQDYAFDKELDRSYEAEGNWNSRRHKRGIMAELGNISSFDGRKAGSKGPLGFQIKNIRTEERELPNWARTNEGIQKVLLTAFPRLQTDDNQRKRAGVWMRILYLYHRLGYPSSEIAKELGYKTRAPIDMAIMRINRVAVGLTVHGTIRKA